MSFSTQIRLWAFLLFFIYHSDAIASIILQDVTSSRSYERVSHLAQNRLDALYNAKTVEQVYLKEVDININIRDEIQQNNELTLIEVEGIPIEIKKRNSYIDEKGRLRWKGMVLHDPLGQVNLVVDSEGNVFGNLTASKKNYSIKALENGLHLVVQHRYDPTFERNHSEAMDSLPRHLQVPVANRDITPGAASSSDDFIDIYVFYSDDLGLNAATAEAEIQSDIDYVNDVLENSCADFRYRVVGTGQLNFNESGNASTDLDTFYQTAAVETARDTYGADLTMLWVSNTNACGIAGGAHSIKNYNCEAATTAHELGHNTGLMHDRYELNVGLYEGNTYKGGYGWVDLGNQVRSIMAYNTECTAKLGKYCERVPYYSSSQIFIDGNRFGVEHYVDSVKKVNTFYSTVAGYKSAKSNYSPKIDKSKCVRPQADENKEIHCFIATAAFGSYLHPYVIELRKFRDNFLKRHYLGRKLVKFYYRYSPPLANFIEQNSWLKPLARISIMPFIAMVLYPMATFALIGLCLFMSFYLMVFKRKV